MRATTKFVGMEVEAITELREFEQKECVSVPTSDVPSLWLQLHITLLPHM